MPFLDVQGVTMRFGSLVANKDVSFSIEQGQIVGLIGPNGSGKTTLFNCVSGLYKPSGGHIVFDGTDITGEPAYKIARMGLTRTFQVVRPLKEMSVLENVMVGAYLRTSDRAKALETANRCVDLCFLSEWKDNPAGAMTIGNKKRLEVARILATSPKLLLLDEAVAGLTSTEIKDMVALITRLRKEGMTILMVEHIMEAIMPISDKIVVLNSGIKIAEGEPAEITRNEEVIKAYLGEKYTQRLAKNKAANKTTEEIKAEEKKQENGHE